MCHEYFTLFSNRPSTTVRFLSTPATLLSSPLLWLCSGPIWSFARPAVTPLSTRAWSKYWKTRQNLSSVVGPKMWSFVYYSSIKWRSLSANLSQWIFASIYIFTYHNYFQELGAELWSRLWNHFGCLPFLHPRHGQGSSHVPTEVSSYNVAKVKQAANLAVNFNFLKYSVAYMPIK